MPRNVYDVAFVALDFETTGPTLNSEVVEVGAVKFDLGSGESSAFEQLVRPNSRISLEAQQVHGITNEMVQRQPKFSAVLPFLQAYIGDCVVVAHNARYEMKLSGLSNQFVDTLRLARKWIRSSGLSLGALMHHENRHRALPDARASARLLKQIVGRIEDKKGVVYLSDLTE